MDRKPPENCLTVRELPAFTTRISGVKLLLQQEKQQHDDLKEAAQRPGAGVEQRVVDGEDQIGRRKGGVGVLAIWGGMALP